jgi:hypothetical protein
MFIRVRGSWYPHDSIDAIVEVGGRLRVDLCNGVKIDLDPIESEKVLKQLGKVVDAPAEPVIPTALLQRINFLETQVMSMKAQLVGFDLAKPKARMKNNA